MINRVLLRIKVIQLLYAYYQSNSTSAQNAEKELFLSINKTYELFHLMLLLIVELTRFAEDKIERGLNKYRPSHEELHPNPRFMLNAFARQMKTNDALNNYCKEHKVNWAEQPELIKTLFEAISASAIYQEYMSSQTKSYEEDKKLWRKIFTKIILGNKDMEELFEDMSIYWNDDVDTVISFVEKVIKRFEEKNRNRQALLPMFKDDDDRLFLQKLFNNSIENGSKYREIIRRNITNWDLERVALMDIIIMQTAVAELMSFPSIPANVTLNEYIELAKTYSTENSSVFVNGVLNNVVNELREENKLVKAASF